MSLLAILWNSAIRWVYLFFSPLSLASLLFTDICKAASDSHFAWASLLLGSNQDHPQEKEMQKGKMVV